ncbi:MAG TPA: FecR domain-containing protein [Candidatus Omnitrophota bacterium]|nr:FecR domain-containing protein [Candidatus Omnitrophota bacterium]HRY86012.1 FecR domain-containing protein [Candidatus Omnitrophota bacterium]
MRYGFLRSFVLTACLSFVAVTWGFAASSAEHVQVGVVGVAHGPVEGISPQSGAKLLRAGDKVYLDDELRTGADALLQILLLDETVFTLGPSSAIRVSEFVHDPLTHEGKIKANVIQGFFRIVSGRIAHKKPENMSVDLPAGSIGFRGTLVAGRSQGLRSLVVLLGPVGADGVPPGRIVVANIVNGESVSVEVREKGYGTVIEGAGLAPLPPFKIPDQEMALLLDALGRSMAGAGGNVLENAGGLPTGSFDSSGMLGTLSQMSQMDEYAQRAAQGGMLTPPQIMTTPVTAGGREGGDDNNN